MHFDGYVLSLIQVGQSFDSQVRPGILIIIQLFIYELEQLNMMISSKIAHTQKKMLATSIRL